MFQMAVPTQDMTNPVSLPSFYCVLAAPLLLAYMEHLISHTIDPTNPSFSSTTFQNLQGISYLISEVTNFL
jgi:hypothetical protein